MHDSHAQRWRRPVCLLLALFFCAGLFLVPAPARAAGDFAAQTDALWLALAGSQELAGAISGRFPIGAGYSVFLSASDGTSRATVQNGWGFTLKEAYDEASALLSRTLAQRGRSAKWLKADVVTEVTQVSRAQLALNIRSVTAGFYRKGLALDAAFTTAFLEQELNANGVYSHERGVDAAALNAYLASMGRQPVDLPDTLYAFSCHGFLLDANGETYALGSSPTSLDYGRRTESVDKPEALSFVLGSAKFLSASQQANGRFVYGYYPGSGEVITGYNTLRHAGTTWCMAMQYAATGDASVLRALQKAVRSLVGSIKSDGNGALYLVNDSEANVGGNGLAILALTEYMNAAGTKQYAATVERLGDGIIKLQNPESGKYFQAIGYPSFNRTVEFRTEFYDGEATFGLAKLYGFCQKQKYLDAAMLAADYMIAAHYENFASNWVSYALNEITKHTDEQRFYDMGIRNFQQNANRFSVTQHTHFELMMATFELYDRMISVKGSAGPYNFDRFLGTLRLFVQQSANAFFYPEHAMYMWNPNKILGACFVRSDAFRVRIDDVQHAINGYCYFVNNYERIARYL